MFSLASDNGKGSFSASTLGAFIRRYTVHIFILYLINCVLHSKTHPFRMRISTVPCDSWVMIIMKKEAGQQLYSWHEVVMGMLVSSDNMKKPTMCTSPVLYTLGCRFDVRT